ncbi:hypothetical protein JDV02_002910 [Purpureocillium takamizusanense]|uniref:Mid2 domain-containing protein n=1 Tax=Purpureocillium takamizusanense TaxID=2060973 RepID=A0A9Q8Q9L3_9HYPO|nr:uncharacterized protein JDV02_002910 [Purpureocillium takamizusanense]UNI16479.1 hypothetical protein JDV02_002910 [Purpureocillium takamizusanense]
MLDLLWKLSLLVTWLCGFATVAESSELVVRNLPGHSPDDTVREIRRRLDLRAKSANTTVLFDNSTSLDAALNDKTLFEFKTDNVAHRLGNGTNVHAGIQIRCAKCYIKGVARAKLTKQGSFNGSDVLDDIKNNTKSTFNSITGYWNNVTSVIKGNIKNMTLDEITTEIEQLPPPQIDFNVRLDFPDYQLQVAFVNTELYVELNTILSSGLSYSLTLYSSKNFGIDLENGLFVGVVFSIDLLLSVDNEVVISSGFHVKLDDEVLMTIALFSKQASGLEFKGGKFRFLPVTIQSESTVFRAVLRLQLRTGFSIRTLDPGIKVDIGDLSTDQLKASAGIEARVYANVAEFVTNVTLPGSGSDSQPACALKVVQDYKLAIGAAAGASLAFLGNTYGPTPATEIPIFYTTLASACLTRASIATSSASPTTARAVRRAKGDPSTTTTVTTVTYTATACMSPGLMNCPASLQTVSKNVVTKTLSAAVVSGSSVVWSTAVATAIATVPFPRDAMTLTGSSGAPKSYVPPPPTTTTGRTQSSGVSASPTETATASSEDTGGVNKKLILGLTLGLGLPALIAIIGASIIVLRRRRDTRFASFIMTDEAEPPQAMHKNGKHRQTMFGYAAVQDHD